MKVFGLAITLLLLLQTYAIAQVNTASNDRFGVSFISKSLNQQGASGKAMMGLEASLYNKSRTLSFSAFALTEVTLLQTDYEAVIANDRISTNGTFRRNFNAIGISIQRQFFSKKRFELSLGSALSQIWYDETIRDFDSISFGPSGFVAFEPSANFSYQITNRFSFKVTPSYLVALGEQGINSFQRFNIGMGLGIRF